MTDAARDSARRRSFVLCGMDFSEGAMLAFERAALIASSRNCDLLLVHVTDSDRQEDAFSSEMAQHMLVRADASSVRVSTRTVSGRPSQVLGRIGEEAGCVLVVLGANLKPSLGEWLLGSTGEWVVRHCKTPILFVRNRPNGPYQRVLACLDFEPSSQQALEHALALGLVDGGKVALVHAYQTPLRHAMGALDLTPETVEDQAQAEGNAATERAVAIVKALGLERLSRIYIKEGESYPMIAEAATHAAADLLVMGSQGRTPLADFFLGSTVSEALRRSPCDVLVKRAS